MCLIVNHIITAADSLTPKASFPIMVANGRRTLLHSDGYNLTRINMAEILFKDFYIKPLRK
jgi:hypothetical protein